MSFEVEQRKRLEGLIAAIKQAPLTGDGIDPFAARMLVGEIDRLRAELGAGPDIIDALGKTVERLEDECDQARAEAALYSERWNERTAECGKWVKEVERLRGVLEELRPYLTGVQQEFVRAALAGDDDDKSAVERAMSKQGW